MLTPQQPSQCLADRCPSYRPGHLMHWIHAKRIGQTPWGWRDATVVAIDGLWLTLSYVVGDHVVRAWHHQSLGDQVQVGSPVRLHEQYYALGGPFGWVNVALTDGLGPVPEPDDVSLWAAETTVAVTDLSTGHALPMDHTGTDDDGDARRSSLGPHRYGRAGRRMPVQGSRTTLTAVSPSSTPHFSLAFSKARLTAAALSGATTVNAPWLPSGA